MGNRLRMIRKTKGLTQKWLSEVSSVPRVCIARYESGKYNIGVKNAVKLASALGVTVDELIGKEAG